MSDFKEHVHDLFSYLKSPHFEYHDYLASRDYHYDDDDDDDDTHDYDKFSQDDFFSHFSNSPIETCVPDILCEYFRNPENGHYGDFTKETNIYFLNNLKLQFRVFTVLFDENKIKDIDSHFVSRLLTPYLKFDKNLYCIKELLTILIKIILSDKIINNYL